MSKPKTCLRRLREWEKGDPENREVRVLRLGFGEWRVIVRVYVSDPSGFDEVRRTGDGRENMCYHAYVAAVARGIIEEVPDES